MSSEFEKHIKKQLGEDLYMKSVPTMRWDSGIYKLNSALGGGFPACQISELVGKESSGKTMIASKLAGVVSSTDYDTGQRCEHKEGNCKVLYVDQEGTLDPVFCEGHNYLPEAHGNLVLATKTGNQAIDVINAAINSCEYSLIVLDSLEVLVPYRDLDKSSEDAVMGTKAKMNNDAFRRWTVSLMESRHNKALWWQRPTLLIINQLRDAIGTVPMPAQIPGGVGQKQAASIIIQLNQPKYANDGKLASKVEIKGVVKKNKTYTPRAEISFEVALRELPEEGLKKGQVDNITSVLQDIRKYSMWEKRDDGMWQLFEFSAEKQTDFRQMMIDDKQTEIDITKQVIERLKT